MTIERIVIGSVEFEGVRLVPEQLRAVTVWCRGKANETASLSDRSMPSQVPPLILTTAKGEELADFGDWILKNDAGEFTLVGPEAVTDANRKGVVG